MKSRTRSSPPNPRNAAVSMTAPIRMANTREVVLVVSSNTRFKVPPVAHVRQRLQPRAMARAPEATAASTMPAMSAVPSIFRRLTWKRALMMPSATRAAMASRVGQKASR